LSKQPSHLGRACAASVTLRVGCRGYRWFALVRRSSKAGEGMRECGARLDPPDDGRLLSVSIALRAAMRSAKSGHRRNSGAAALERTVGHGRRRRMAIIIAAAFSAVVITPLDARAETCREQAKAIDAEMAAQRTLFNQKSAALYARYNSKINAELAAVHQVYLARLQGVRGDQAKSIRDQYQGERARILTQWNSYRVEKQALAQDFGAFQAQLSRLRRDALPGRCVDKDASWLRRLLEATARLIQQPSPEPRPEVTAGGVRG